MRDLIAGIIGVPAAMGVAGGLGIMALTIVSRIRGHRDPPLRWAHLMLGVGITGAGALLAQFAVLVSPPG